MARAVNTTGLKTSERDIVFYAGGLFGGADRARNGRHPDSEFVMRQAD